MPQLPTPVARWTLSGAALKVVKDWLKNIENSERAAQALLLLSLG